ncbi:non-specific serine/threonine protein kinase [Ranunculus cassubicifolius]
MERRRDPELVISIWLLLFSTIFTRLSYSSDSISAGQSLFSNQTLSSKEGNFELGFFAPGNSQNYYIGIWYKNVSAINKTYVWVANRNTPLTDSNSSELKLLESGDLVLYDQLKTVVWSTNTTSNAMNSSRVVLGDNGNLILENGIDRFKASDVYWQSFDYPTDTLLPGAKLGYDNRTKRSRPLTSWKNPNDPAKGMYSLELDPIGEQILMKWNGTEEYWSSGRWNGSIFSGIPEMSSDYILKFLYENNVNESYFSFDFYDSATTGRFVMELSGQVKQRTWDTTSKQWFLFWTQPRQQCDVNAFCGANGVCSQNGFPFCKCMDGFEPRSQTDWNMADYSSSGCVRKYPLQCGKDDLSPLPNVKLPKHPMSMSVGSANECKSACLNNCSCSAYSYNTECSIWNGDLFGVQLSDGDGYGGDLYLKVSAFQSSGGKNKGTITTVIVGVATGIVALLGLVLLVIWIWKKMLLKKGELLRSIFYSNISKLTHLVIMNVMVRLNISRYRQEKRKQRVRATFIHDGHNRESYK